MHLRNVMFKMKTDIEHLNMRDIRTCLHDAPVFELIKPTCEKSKNNVSYNGAVTWKNLHVNSCNIEAYKKFKFQQKKWALSQL